MFFPFIVLDIQLAQSNNDSTNIRRESLSIFLNMNLIEGNVKTLYNNYMMNRGLHQVFRPFNLLTLKLNHLSPLGVIIPNLKGNLM